MSAIVCAVCGAKFHAHWLVLTIDAHMYEFCSIQHLAEWATERAAGTAVTDKALIYRDLYEIERSSVRRVRDLHQWIDEPWQVDVTPMRKCMTCGTRYPCPTVRALDNEVRP